MAIALTDAFIYWGASDLTGETNQVQIDASTTVLDASTFASGGWQEVVAGLKTVDFTASGFMQSTSPTFDAATAVDRAFGGLSLVHTVGVSETEGARCYLFQGRTTHYQVFGEHGQLAPFSYASKSSNGQGLAGGLLAKARGNVSATGAIGSGVQLGAVGATEYLYGSIHIFSAGTTVTLVLESDDNSNFTSATTRATIGPLTGAGGAWATRVAGAITDTWYRYRVTAITGTFNLAGAIGVN